MALDKGLAGIALTDHDTIDGLAEAQLAASNNNLIFLPGIEFSTYWQGIEIHLLGYGIDSGNDQIVTRLKTLQKSRINRAKAILAKLNNLGFKISWEEVKRHSQGKAIGRPHIANALLAKGYVKSVHQAFGNLLGSGKPAFVPREKLSPQEAVLLISDAGGVSVLAHPGLLNSDKIVLQLISLGISGIEVFYPEHTLQQQKKFLTIASNYQLVITGGSDFHGEKIRNGIQIGECAVNDNVIECLR